MDDTCIRLKEMCYETDYNIYLEHFHLEILIREGNLIPLGSRILSSQNACRFIFEDLSKLLDLPRKRNSLSRKPGCPTFTTVSTGGMGMGIDSLDEGLFPFFFFFLPHFFLFT